MAPEKLGRRKVAKLGRGKQIYSFPLLMQKHGPHPSGQGRQPSLSGSFRRCVRRRYCFILHCKKGHFFKLTIFPLTLFQSSLFTVYSCRLQDWDKWREIQILKSFKTSHRAGMLFSKGRKSANVYVLAQILERASWTAHKWLPFRNNKSHVRSQGTGGWELIIILHLRSSFHLKTSECFININ